MNFIRTYNKKSALRYIRYLCSAAQQQPGKLLIEKLSDRGLIRVAGKDVNPFLQGLVTNDVEHLHRGSQAIYALFLNKAGRIMYDSIIYRAQEDNTLLIECDTEILNDLLRHLKMFRVRRKISIDPVSSELQTWVVHGGQVNADPDTACLPKTSFDTLPNKDVLICHDPRLKYLGTRVVTPEKYTQSAIEKLFPDDELMAANIDNDFTTLRYKLGVGEGIDDHPPGKSLPIESNGDYLHGISFQKGCYLGQELTARTYHTGVIRKRLMPVCITQEIGEVEPDKEISTTTGASVGKLRGHRNRCGLALLRIEKVLNESALMVNGVECKASRPFWWPGIMPKRRQVPVVEMESPT